MTSLDTNILVNALASSASNHKEAHKGIEELDDFFCVTPTNIGETLRILTHPKVFERPLKLSKAVHLLGAFLDAYGVLVLDESVDWWKELPELEKAINDLKGNEIFDARIALCLRSHGIKRIFTWDSDFQKYSFLRTL